MDKQCCNCKHKDGSVEKYPCRVCYRAIRPFVEFGIEQKDLWEPAEVDMVNRPPHYTHGKYECIDVMVDTFGKEAVQHFCLLNAFKYVWRSEHKNGIEDVKKAWWYLDKYLQLEGEMHD